MWLIDLPIFLPIFLWFAPILKDKNLTTKTPRSDQETVVTDTKMKYPKYVKSDVYYLRILLYLIPT